MIAVSDTSPLCYLILVGEIDQLRKLFTEVRVPRTVIGELLHEDAPAAVREWASNLPAWLRVKEDPTSPVAGLEKLQAGERSAILLAESTKADIILLDEKSARRLAGARGLQVTGTLGLLAEGGSRGLLDLPSAIDRLRKTNFRISPALLKATLDRFSRRQV
jgi:predicted nucleic acid-binding protein